MDFNDFNSAFAELRDMGLVSVNAAVFDHHEYDGEIIGSTHGYDYVEELDVAIRRKRKTMAKWPDGYYMIIPAHIKNGLHKMRWGYCVTVHKPARQRAGWRYLQRMGPGN
ncbi:hypothetical protein OQE50_24190 (plasmid) [Enterobacter kobei]|uniref:hypothetical protein n=1 Tax=Enterobacter kobei TaxID=208224 RepID=UPI00224A846E|nr:hypothetical protein [Enterobacter kobei]UZQ70278.1 hypothetical protein OQE50_24190 [Enterobacter kobei]